MRNQCTIAVFMCSFCNRLFVRSTHHKPKRLDQQFCSKQCANQRPALTRAQRFWLKVRVGALEDCWPWLAGCFQRDGEPPYGAFSVNHQNRPAHQVAWELTNGVPFPSGKQGNHSCDFSLCCNPAHVYPGTQQQNMSDMVERGRSLKGDRHPSRRRLDRSDIRMPS
jgi:hypothetical protein